MDLDGSSSDFSFHDTGFSVSLARIHQCCTSGGMSRGASDGIIGDRITGFYVVHL